MENFISNEDVKPNVLDLRVELDDFDIGIFDSEDAQLDDTFITQLLDPELYGSDQVQTLQNLDAYQFCQSTNGYAATNTLESLLKGPSPPEDTVTPAPATSSLSQPNLQTFSTDFSSSGPAVHDTLIALLLKQKEDAKQKDALIEEISVLLMAQGGRSQNQNEFSSALSRMNLTDLQQLHDQLKRTQTVKTEPTPISSTLPKAHLIVTKPDSPIASSVTKNSDSLPVSITSSVKEPVNNISKTGTIRKSSHNAIEKRYRCSINDRIEELRNLLVGQDGKLSKSAVLRKSLERIRYLEKENERLRRELNFRSKESSRIDSSSEDAMTPQSEADIDDDSQMDSSNSVDSSITKTVSYSRPRLMSLLETKPIVGSGTAIFVAPCLFFLLLSMPHFIDFHNVNNKETAASFGASSRHINWWSSEQTSRFALLLRTFIYTMWILGWMLFCVLSSRLFYSWYKRVRQITDNHNSTIKDAIYWQNWTQANHYLTIGSFSDASRHLEISLESCGAGRLPYSNMEWFSFIIKQLIRYYLGRLLPYTFDKNDAAAAGRCYGRLLQLQLSGHVRNTEHCWLGWLVLANWNMLDMAESALTGAEKLEIQCALGISVKQCMPMWLGNIISNWFYSCCSQLVQNDSRLSQYNWLSTQEGYRFLCHEAICLEMNTTPYWCILDIINFEFILHMQKRILIGIFNGCENKKYERYANLLERILISCETENKTPVKEAAHWFSALACSIAYTNIDYHIGVKRLHSTVNRLPNSLKKTKLAQSLLLSYRVHHYTRNRLSNDDNIPEYACMQACTAASKELNEISPYINEDKTTQIFCVFALDWLLDARSKFVFHGDYQLQCFQKDLDLLRMLTLKIGSGYQKWVSHHSASLHVISHANPLCTGMLLRGAE